ncbi:hypothetical protein IJH97_00065 [Candidatus Saccharibacteria bacterium]|nr:hypothetical protein [Candidatus Saccharibacteria bacterium]
MTNDKILRDYAMKNDKKSEIFHSSGMAAVGSGDNIGAGTESIEFAKRQAIDEQQRVIGRYRDAGLGQVRNQSVRAKVYSGEAKRGFGRKEGSGPEHQGYGRSEMPATRGYGRTDGGPEHTPQVPTRRNAGISLH